MFIYLIVNHETGKYYVGQHKGNNLKKYLQKKLSSARHQHSGQSHLFNAMRKYPQSSIWSIHALRDDIQTRTELDETERDFIKFLRSQDPEYGYNICQGGEGFTGPHTEETRANIAEATRKYFDLNPEVSRLRGLKISETKQKNKKPLIMKGCPICNKTFFMPFGRRGVIYCSQTCYQRSPRRIEVEQTRIESHRIAMQSPTTRRNLAVAQSARRMEEKRLGIKPTMPVRIWTKQARQEQAERMRLQRRGKPMPETQRLAISNALKGLVCDDTRKLSLDRGRHTRWHSSKGVVADTCRFCLEGLSKPN